MQSPTNLIEDLDPKFNHIAEYFIFKIILFFYPFHNPFQSHKSFQQYY